MNIDGIEVTVLSTEDIVGSEAAIMACPSQPKYQTLWVEGSTPGFPCSLCEQDCVLAPSSQIIHAFGKNPIVCFECMLIQALQEPS